MAETVFRCKRPILILTTIFLVGCSILGVGDINDRAIPKEPILLDIDDLSKLKTKINGQDSVYTFLYENLLAQANKMLYEPELSVIYQPNITPEISINDYNSLAIYFWPNPDTENGFPYVKRAGSKNPQAKETDSKALKELYNHIKILTLAGYLSNDPKYYDKVTKLVDHWFFNDETRMNPNFTYTQSIPGVRSGSIGGFTEAVNLAYLLDYFIIINQKRELSEKFQYQLTKWYSEFNSWFINHPRGQELKTRKNNLGSYHDVLYIYFNHFLRNKDEIPQLLESTTKKRIKNQIDSQGRQLEALQRANSWDYSIYNLEALTIIATYAQKIGINLWTLESSEGDILKAINLLLNTSEGKAWTNQQRNEINTCELYPIVGRLYSSNIQTNFVKRINEFLKNNKKKCASLNYFTLPPLPTEDNN